MRTLVTSLRVQVVCLSLFFFSILSGCAVKKTSFPTGIYPKEMTKVPEPNAAAAWVPAGYKVEVFMKDLIWPSSIEFDENENVYVAEAGYVYGDPFAPAQVLRINPNGQITRFAEGFNGPITDLLWHKGRLYVSHKGKISAVGNDGAVVDLVTGLPSHGDHFNNEMSVGPDGKIYFGQGTATNSGVVGLDNAYPYVWLLLHPDVHDVPARDMRLSRESFLTPQPNNVLARQGRLISFGRDVSYAVSSVFNRSKNTSMLVRTRAYQPFGEKSRDVKGQVKASGTILRMNPDGSGLEVYAWGLRNPYGVQWGPDGQLYVTDNAYDERGSRPIANAKDNIFQVKQGGFYGFPDFSSGIPVTAPQFRSARGPKIKFLMADHPPVEQPWLIRPENAAATQFDFSTNSSFGFKGHMFLAEFGSGTPLTGEDKNLNGYTVSRIDPATKETFPFLSNKIKGPTGKEYVSTEGPRHPVEAKFSTDGTALYVVDIGVIGFALAGAGPFPVPSPGTGVIWRITKEGSTSSRPPANLSPLPPQYKK
ncbi:PQQ-dependent sugar dehydrogenase [Aridibaculum aurantiacum]|uniref:PQQ-dependent sugar dehydrogenase n=1 Tax=Aridibaculum aurantiacum TaxID=2810307 RepID=UPI001A9733B1|nr:PQQ-dependent sugar dehydrogenase [Aridibaculum aurantiacum]